MIYVSFPLVLFEKLRVVSQPVMCCRNISVCVISIRYLEKQGKRD